MLVDAATKSGNTQPVATYEIVSGAPGMTFLVIEPMESMKALDEEQQQDAALFQSMGEEGIKRYTNYVSEAIVNNETLLFAINSKMSYPDKAWITADPDFWAPKPAKTTQKAPTKTGTKTSASK